MIGIITVTYKKPTLDLVLTSINRLRTDFSIDIPCVCVGEEKDKAFNSFGYASYIAIYFSVHFNIYNYLVRLYK